MKLLKILNYLRSGGGDKWRLILIGVAILMPVLTWFFGLAPQWVEQYYTQDVSRIIALSLARITAPLPFSLFELIIYIVLARLLVLAVLGMKDIIMRRRRVWEVVGGGMLRVGAIGAVFTIFFYVNWGFNFARPDLYERMNWRQYAYDVPASQRADELARLSEELLVAANREYLRAFGTDNLHRQSTPTETEAEVDAAVERGYARATAEVGLPKYFGIARAPAKPIIASRVLSSFLILGMYSPYTGESNYNRLIPPCSLPQVLGHEKAHQRLVTNESEANFFGYLSCVYSDNPYVRYSGYLFAHRQLLLELTRIDLERAHKIIEKRLPGVQRDVYAINMWSFRNASAMEPVGRSINNAYLKANRVKEGIKAYQASSRYLITFAHTRGDSCVVD
jgi:hypothetical protein